MNIEELMENARLKGRVIALEAQVQTLEAEAKVYEAMRRAFAKSDSQEVTRLKAEVERLRKWMDDISLDTEGRLDSGLNVGWTLLKIKQEYNAAKEGKPTEEVLWVQLEDYEKLKAEVERLRKAGTEMGKHLPDTDEANRAYIDFEAGGRS